MKITKKLNSYEPLEGKEKVQIKQSTYPVNTFFKNFFEGLEFDEIIENYYHIKNNSGVVLSIIKTWQPHSINKEINGNLEPKLFDKQFSIVRVDREIKLSYPTHGEIELLKIQKNDMIVVEKNKLISEGNQIVRYEEESFKLDTYIYED